MTEDLKKDKLHPGYIHKYKLRSNPFHLDPEQRHFYVNSTLKQRLDYLNTLVKSDDFLILVIGEEGAGKTTLLNHFLSKASDRWRSCKISASPGSDSKGRFENLKDHPAFILQNEELPVIMLDNAHALTIDELEFLIDLAGRAGQSKLKRVVLFCEPQIQLKLAELSARVADEGTVNKIFIPQLSLNDTSEYLNQRLKMAGFKGKSPFSAGDMKKIFKNSGGLPKKINEEASYILEKKAGNSITEKFRNAGLIAASFLIAAVISFLMLRDSSIMEDAVTINVEKPVETEIKNVEKNTPLEKSEEKDGNTVKDESFNKNDSLTEKEKKETSEKVELAEAETVPVKKEVEKKKVNINVKRVVKRKSGSKIRREKWLLSQKPSYYTVQILGVRKKESLFNFVRKYKLKKFAFFHTSFKNKDWYPLLYGLYPTVKEASSAIKKLPKEFQIYSPWVRQMSSVHRAIKTKKTASGFVPSFTYEEKLEMTDITE